MASPNVNAPNIKDTCRNLDLSIAPETKAVMVAPILKAAIIKPYSLSDKSIPLFTRIMVFTSMNAPAFAEINSMNTANRMYWFLNQSDAPFTKSCQVVGVFCVSSFFGAFIKSFGSFKSKIPAMIKVPASIKNISRTPDQIARIPANPGPNTPNIWYVAADNPIACLYSFLSTICGIIDLKVGVKKALNTFIRKNRI